MSRFFLISSSKNKNHVSDQSAYLKQACEKINLEYIEINAHDIAVSELPQLRAGDLLYRNASTKRAKNIEKIIMCDGVATFYGADQNLYQARKTSYFQNLKNDIPVIPTYPLLPSSRTEIEESVIALGGFPIIVKIMGSSKGVGVIKVDSLESYKSILDYVASQDAAVLLRKFIPHTHYGRLIVVGEEVVASNQTIVPDKEFRSNTSENTDANRTAIVYDKTIQNIAIKAVATTGLQFGGVDIIFDSVTGLPYVAEVNFPCQFEYAQRITGIDIALSMVKFLLEKSTKIADANTAG